MKGMYILFERSVYMLKYSYEYPALQGTVMFATKRAWS